MQTLLSLRLKPSKPSGPFEPKPGEPDQLVALLPEPAQAKTLAVLLTQTLPPPRAHACGIQSQPPVPVLSAAASEKAGPLCLSAALGGWGAASGSAAIQCRFYDLATGMATLISSAGKKHSLGECGRRLLRFQEKAWLTFFGYQSLSEFAALPPTPLTRRIDAKPGRRAPKWGRKQKDSRRCSGLCRRSCFRCSLHYPA